MRKLLFLLMILSISVFSLSSATTFSGTGRNIGFELILNRQGVDEIWFDYNKSKDATHGASISPLYFPLLTNNTSSLTATVCFHWIRQGSIDVLIKLSFVANTSNTDDMKGSGYMLRMVPEVTDKSKTNKETKNGMNFNVSIIDSSDTAKSIGKIKGESYKYETMPAEDVTATNGTTKTPGRSIVFNPDLYTSPAIITMTIEPPTDTVDGSGNPQWQYEAQYGGYIRAEIYTKE